ncbi:molybdopterin synthase catalytic subunit MoaE [Psychrosphaera sp. B3R10]|uniref:Molybdopterin synthase catalytic subunit MoaE n=1 Tax=Psychrosphaera algicola TaxID=3023714 RepID=A0ABT5FAD0_9GAMM|nr:MULTISPECIES: molybdopterin synthase catalytic subunit MoaE [unclassified Psychrosphaera]MBU2883493.1 molybdopterin synthase catalytic subunit MoaE [Psychrosphaera sp. I2R16]MBU2989672.1 molybdopterin synthase catalytic subunit MoaE [Psychrosphaera sp. B3R10]MDC2888492.1 molybdopterin synthase catalytic subunit MoaE [Psychrosphaera sp. G1-22]MDO6719887.1 molybdopterin synthase catalytic subunit MoaE [Psychrosphaera sp. 1_MG-2023]
MLNSIRVLVQNDDFDLGSEYQKLLANDTENGAVVTFTGLVRDYNQGHQVLGLTLEHYPGMTEKALETIALEAKQKWPLGRITIIHRVGSLGLSEQIVFVGVTSKHREAAFSASQFIMDYLKNDAPFWKKEQTTEGERWVEFNDKDKDALSRW